MSQLDSLLQAPVRLGALTSVLGVTSVMVSGVYFLGCSTAIQLSTSTNAGAAASGRHNICGNIFYAGVPIVPTQANYCVVLNNCSGSPASGSVISGNVFTDLYSATSGAVNNSPVQLTGSTNYVTVSGNTCLGQNLVNDTTNNPNNYSGPNLEGGTANQQVFREAPNFDKGVTLTGVTTSPSLWGSIKNDGVGNIVVAPAKNLLLGTSTSQGISFYGHATANQSTVSGAKGGNAALSSLLAALSALGLIVDGTSA